MFASVYLVPSFIRTYYTERCHRQRRRLSDECAITFSRDSGLPSGTSDRLPPLRWAVSMSAQCRDHSQPSRSMCPKSFENPSWLPRVLSCRAIPAHSAFNQTRTRAPSRPVGPPLRSTQVPSCQALRRSVWFPCSLLLKVVKIPALHFCICIIPFTTNFNTFLHHRSGLPIYWHLARLLLDRVSPHVQYYNYPGS